MAEVLVQFETIVAGPSGSRWIPRACGRAQADGLWEGWIEFEPVNSADQPRRTARESVQPNRNDLLYWAQGLTQTYLEGALRRALHPTRIVEERIAPLPRFDGPAPNRAPRDASPGAVLNPFDVYQQGEDILVRQLSAMSAARLRDIAVAYGFASRQAADAETADMIALTILDGVRKRPSAP